MYFDLLGHEIQRRALMAEASPEDESDEAKAWELLYSGLDEQQQEIYDMLVEKGVIPG